MFSTGPVFEGRRAVGVFSLVPCLRCMVLQECIFVGVRWGRDTRFFVWFGSRHKNSRPAGRPDRPTDDELASNGRGVLLTSLHAQNDNNVITSLLFYAQYAHSNLLYIAFRTLVLIPIGPNKKLLLLRFG